MTKTRFSDTDWKSYAATASTRSIDATFADDIKTSKDARVSFDPKTITVRESRDSEAFPKSNAIILAFDVTGSMGQIPYHFIQKGLGILMNEIYTRKPVADPHIACMAIGDVECDRHPLQVTQFESDIKIARDLEDIYVESGGGGNDGESYNAAHYFAATKTSIDCFEKRGDKGLLFTIGDEPPLMILRKADIARFIGGEPHRDLTSADVVEMASKTWDLFHVVVTQGSGYRGHPRVAERWSSLLPQGHVLMLDDHTKLSEVVVSAIQVRVGADRDAVVGSWSGDTSLVVSNAVSKSLAARSAIGSGVSRL